MEWRCSKLDPEFSMQKSVMVTGAANRPYRLNCRHTSGMTENVHLRLMPA